MYGEKASSWNAVDRFLNAALHERYLLIRTKQIKTRNFRLKLCIKYWFGNKILVSPNRFEQKHKIV
jgi:hypothetical protein